jgi:hypothetical protein
MRAFVFFCVFFLAVAADMSAVLPENTPTDRFFKYSFTRIDGGDVKSLSILMKEVYLNLCTTLGGCRRTEALLEDLYQRRYVELEINMSKMRKLGLLFQRLIAAGAGGDEDGA